MNATNPNGLNALSIAGSGPSVSLGKGQGVTSAVAFPSPYPPPFQSTDESIYENHNSRTLAGITYVDNEGHSYHGADLAYAIGAICQAQPSIELLFKQEALHGERLLKLLRALHISLVGGEIATAAQYEALNTTYMPAYAQRVFNGLFYDENRP